MHIYFSGIGGAGIGPLALMASQAGFEVSGSDAKENSTTKYLRQKGLTNIHTGQSYEQIAAVHNAKPIDWFVYTSALPIDQPDAPELKFCAEHGIKTSLRDEFLSYFLQQKNLQMIAVAGTHGKTTTTAMTIWLAKQIGLPISYPLPGKINFAEMSEFDPASEYLVYEADEYNRNFLAFHPAISMITGVDWDHPDIFPTREDYNQAFRDFINQSQRTVMWQDDAKRLGLEPGQNLQILGEHDPAINDRITLPGLVNRQNAWQAVHALQPLTEAKFDDLIKHANNFPGVARRFEQIAPNLYTDYAHTPPKIRGALQLAHETASDNVVVVYEGLHNTRQHFIKDELKHLFDSVKHLYIVPSYLAREDPGLPLLSPADLRSLLSRDAQSKTTPSELDKELVKHIKRHLAQNDLVLCLSAGGSGSLDEWLRQNFKTSQQRGYKIS